MRHETKLNVFRDDDSVEWTLDDYESSAQRRLTLGAALAGLSFFWFAVGWIAKGVELKSGHAHRPAIERESELRAP